MTTIALLAITPGLVIAGVCTFYTLQDWALLAKAYAEFERVASSTADLRAVFVAESRQNLYRLNCFADGVGVLGGLIIAAIGITGSTVVASRDQ